MPIKGDMRGRLRNPATRYVLYELLALRDGRKCAKCNVLDSEKELVIDHIDGNTLNWALTNLRLLCRACNVPKRWAIPSDPIDSIPYVRERECVQNDNGLMMGEASPEIRINRDREPQYRRWLMNRLLSDRVLLRDAINGGAEACHISPTTARRYLAKMLSSEGPLRVLDEWVVVKSEHWGHLMEEEFDGSKEKEADKT